MDNSAQQSLFKEPRYVIVTCRSKDTLSIARGLYANHGLEAFAPRVTKRTHKPGEKRILPLLPGFVFLPEDRYKEADELQKKRLVPKFTPLVLACAIKTCTQRELEVLDRAYKDTKIEPRLYGRRLRVGEQVTINKGPLVGIVGIVTEVFVASTLVVKLKTDFCSSIELPAALLGDA